MRLQGDKQRRPPLTNTLKHAAARRVRVTVEHRDDRLEIAVTDDGHGGVADPSKGA
jgi:signal transduction histidine kinase